MQLFNVKAPGESVNLTFIFANGLGPGETMTGTISTSVAVLTGTDANPNGILNGNPGYDSTATQVIVPVTGGMSGTTYQITVTATTSNSKKTLVLAGALPVSNPQ